MVVVRRMVMMMMVMSSRPTDILRRVIVEAKGAKGVVVGRLSGTDDCEVVVWLVVVMVMAAVRQLSECDIRVGIILMAVRMVMVMMCRMSMLCPL